MSTAATVNTTRPRIAPGSRDVLYLGVFAAAVSLVAFVYFFLRHEILLYGDATAHIHIARRVFDSRNPGFSQLGTVWLPLPHLLMIPFILPIGLWRSGIGGSIPSMVAFVAGTIGAFRLVRGALPDTLAARIAAWAAALIFALNPNLLYLQSTAMTEPLYLALLVWAAVYFSEFVQAARETGIAAQEKRQKALNRCGILLAGAMLTRYDGWFVAAAFAVAAVVVLWFWTGRRINLWRSPMRPAVTRFLLIVAIGPVFWFSYNAIFWGNPLEFATGPYSARAIADRTENNGWRHPGYHAPVTGAVYFAKAAKLNMAGSVPQPETVDSRPSLWRVENVWFPLALLSSVLLLVIARGLWPLLMLWLPLPFYALSIAWGGVPIFVPVWWPFSYYNVRYGLQMLPAFAVFGALLIYLLGSKWKISRVIAVTGVLSLIVAGSYAVAWHAAPACLREARANNASRIPFDRAVATELQKLRPGATVQMYTAHHAAALEFAGFPLRRTINETNEDLWQSALDAPGKHTDYVIAFESPDDPVWRSVQDHSESLDIISIVSALHESRAFVYQRKPTPPKITLPPVDQPPAAQVPDTNTKAAGEQEKKAAEEPSKKTVKKATARKHAHPARRSSRRSHAHR